MIGFRGSKMSSGSGRINNALRNMSFGVLYRLLQTVVPFFMRTVLIYCLGIEYVGLNSLFTSVLQILNFAELGISSAMNFAMYKPIAENDRKKINGLLRLYKTYYFYIGLVILVVGVILVPFLPYLVNKDLPSDVNLYVLYAVYLAPNVLSYWMYSYRCSLLEAHQRNDIISKIGLVLDCIRFFLQFVVLLVFKNYYAYIGLQLGFQIIYQFVVYYYVKKIYPNYEPEGELSEEDKDVIKQRVKDIVTAKLGSVIMNSSDTVVISAFLGLSILAIYQNYFYLISAVISFIGMGMSGAMASIGNSIVMESEEKIFHDFKNMTFILSWVVCVCTCCFLCLFQPFMKIWMGENLMLEFSVVILLCVYFYLHEYNQLFNVYKDAAGLWHEDKLRPLITSLTNLGLNLIMVQYIGLYGVILSTVLSMLVVGMPWLLHNVFTCLFKTNMKSFLTRLFAYTAITIGCCAVTYLLCGYVNIHPIVDLAVKCLIAMIVPCGVYFLLFFKTEEFARTMQIVKKLLKISA